MTFKLSLCAAALFVAAAGCGGGGQSQKTEKTAAESTGAHEAAPAAVDPATAATITGTVFFEGTPPEPQKINMSADPQCGVAHDGTMYTESAVVNDGKLEWVFVYVKSGLEDRMFPTPTEPAVMDQMGCRYEPHVLGVMINQPVRFVNSDETLHNVHAAPTVNKPFNHGMPLKGLSWDRAFDQPEVMVPIKCDVHSWMSAYIGVVSNPCFAVSDSTGAYSIHGLPPGTYTIEAWHEKFGTQTQEVTVGPGETNTADFTFKAPS